MAKVKTGPYDPADYIETADDAVHLLEAALELAFEDGDTRVIASSLGAIARSKGMTDIARETGLSRESLYRALGEDGNPTLNTTVQVIKALGLRLKAATLKDRVA